MFQRVRIRRRERSVPLERHGVGDDGVSLAPKRVALAIGVSLSREWRVLPRWLWILTEIQHVVVVRMPTHAQALELDERGAIAGAGATGGPRERRRNRVRVGAVDRDSRDAISGGLVGKHSRA